MHWQESNPSHDPKHRPNSLSYMDRNKNELKPKGSNVLASLLLFLFCLCRSAISQTNVIRDALIVPSPPAGANLAGPLTNGPALFLVYTSPTPVRYLTNSEGRIRRMPVSKLVPTVQSNFVFVHYFPDSLNNLIWTNFIAHTNGRGTTLWTEREHSPDWPAHPPLVKWNTNGLMWGMKGLTALSPCWETEGFPGMVPVTALTRRHGYTRGHGMGPDGFRTWLAGKKVWFVTTNNEIVEIKVKREVVRATKAGLDYSILLFERDLPPTIESLRVCSWTNLGPRYVVGRGVPAPLFLTEQTGHVNPMVPGDYVQVMKGGDSGSPNLLPMPGELVFTAGRTTSGPSPEMQKDMDELCRLSGLSPKRYQLEWVDLSHYPPYGW